MTTKPEKAVPDLIAGECLAMRTRLLSRTITGIFDEALRPLGVTTGQLNILVAVAKRGPIAPGEVARRLNMEKSTVSRNVDRMRDHGWLVVSPGGSGRGQLLKVGRAGHRLLDQAHPLWEQAQTRAKALLGQSGARSMLEVANSVMAQSTRR